jgi:hypothetical protein
MLAGGDLTADRARELVLYLLVFLRKAVEMAASWDKFENYESHGGSKKIADVCVCVCDVTAFCSNSNVMPSLVNPHVLSNPPTIDLHHVYSILHLPLLPWLSDSS